jgi:hypothetical protein
MSKNLVLKEFKANSFMGISADSPVVIDFRSARKNQNITMLRGDQGTKKSSTLYAIMRMMGAAFGFNLKETYNRTDETVDVEQSFSYDSDEYVATLRGERLSLKRLYKDKYIPESAPVEAMQKIFGNLGIVPIALREMEGKKQIEWFKKTFGVNEEATKKELKIQKSLAEAVGARKDVNRIIKSLTGFINESEMWRNYSVNEKKFSKQISIEKEKQKITELQSKKSEYDRSVNGLKFLKEKRDEKEIKILELKALLEQETNSLNEINIRIELGEKYIAKSNGIVKEFEAAQKDFLNISKFLADQKEWKELLSKEKELNEMEQTVILANGSIDKLRSELLELTASYLPPIKGLDIRTKTSAIDNEDEDEGIFYNGKSLAQLSESEYAGLWMLIWKEKNVCFVFIENISSYGSSFIKVLNDLAKRGEIKVFASEMQRGKKDMSITFETSIH